MAVNDHTLRLVDGLTITINGHLDATEQAILQAWGRAWNELAPIWDRALHDLAAQAKDGAWPSRRVIARAQYAQAALQQTRTHLTGLAAQLPVTVAGTVPSMTRDALAWQARIVQSQLPWQHLAQPGQAALEQVPTSALTRIVHRTTQQVTSLSVPLSVQAEDAVRGALIKGIAVGDNPRTVARDMLARVGGQFAGGSQRAVTIATTEMLDAHRAAAQLWEQANTDTVRGWQWVADLTPRTCISCFVMNGTEHTPDEPGPFDHQRGRCTRVPLAKSWADLGFTGVPEPPSLVPDARAVFDAMPGPDQVRVMGSQSRLDLYRAGQVTWGDLASRRSTVGWRDSFTPTGLGTLRRKAAASAA